MTVKQKILFKQTLKDISGKIEFDKSVLHRRTHDEDLDYFYIN